MIKENPETNASCARAEDLVTYLYAETSETEAARFKRHLEQCASCSDELAAFSLVREDVVEWRNQSLPSFESSHAPGFSGATTPTRKRSAVAALREFFTLAPAWMRAATAMAALAVCVMVVFTVVHFSEPKMVVQVVAPAPTQAQVDALVRQRAEELRGKEKQEAVATVPEKQSVAVVKNQGTAGRAKAKRATVSSVARQEQIRETPGKVKASQAAREQLAELVQTSKDDDGLPRLSDLFDDSNEAH